MRAMQLHRPAAIETAPLDLVDVPPRGPGPGEIALELTACAVCRTDLQIAEGDVAPKKLPIVPGHQMIGRVVALGEGVTDWKIGDRAGVAWLGGACGVCKHCKAGRENLCEAATFTGLDRDGGFAERATARADFALRIPDSFDDLSAAPLLCGGVIGYRALKVSGIAPGQKLGLFGFGASALLALQVARHWGCRVFAVTRSETEMKRARDLGAEWAGGYDDPLPERLDAAVTFAPVGSVVVAALKSLDRGGTVAVNAIHLDEIPRFSYDDLWLERSIKSVANFTRQDAREFLELAAQIPIRTAFDVFDLRNANAALDRLKKGEIAGAAVLKLR